MNRLQLLQWIVPLVAVIPLVFITAVMAGQWLVSRTRRRQLIALRVQFPAPLHPDEVVDWLEALCAWSHPRFGWLPSTRHLTVETIADHTGISHVVIVARKFRDQIADTLSTTIPAAHVSEDAAYLREIYRPVLAAAYKLTSRTRPLADDRAVHVIPILLAGMQPLQQGEQICLQWTLSSVGTPPSPRARSGSDGWLPWWLDEIGSSADLVRAKIEKYAYPLLGACGRVGVTAATPERARALLGRVWPALHQLNAPGVRVTRRWLPSRVVARLMARRRVPLLRWPMRINCAEGAGMIGLPVGTTVMAGLPRRTARQLPPHTIMPATGVVVATSNYSGANNVPLRLTHQDRLRHTWILGPTGTGKTTLMANLALQDMNAGDGVIVVETRGDLTADLLARTPSHRLNDVIVLDPTRTDRLMGFNILHPGATTAGGQGVELAVDHISTIFAEIFRASWGPRTADVLYCGLLTLALTTAPGGGAFTLCELPNLLLDDGFRRYVTRQPVLPSGVRMFWDWFHTLSDAERMSVIAPCLNKVRAFTVRAPLRLMLGQSAGLDLQQVLAERKILLVSLAKGQIGEETARLIGSLFIAALWQTVLGRAALPEHQRTPTWLYVDEFQETMRLPIALPDMFSQARAMGLGITVAHQYLNQLAPHVRDAILGTTQTHVLFQLGHKDAHNLAPNIQPLTIEDLTSLGEYTIAMRPCIKGSTLGPVTGLTAPLPPPTNNPVHLAALSAQRDGVPPTQIEADMTARTDIPAVLDLDLGREQP